MKFSSEGFALFDLVIALVIIGILSSIAVPSFVGTLSRIHAGIEAQSILRGMQWAKSSAISTSMVVTYTAQADCAWSATNGNITKTGGSSMPYGVSCAVSNPESVYFLPNGRIVKSSDQSPLTQPVSFTVKGGGEKWTIAVYPTGMISKTASW